MSISSASLSTQSDLTTPRFAWDKLEAFGAEISIRVSNIREFEEFIKSDALSRDISIIKMSEELYNHLTSPLRGRTFSRDKYNFEILKFLGDINSNHHVSFTTPSKEKNPAEAIRIGKKEKTRALIIEYLRAEYLSNKRTLVKNQLLSVLPNDKSVNLISEYAVSYDPTSFPFAQTSYILEVFKDSRLVRMAQLTKVTKKRIEFFKLLGRENSLSLREIAKVVKVALSGLQILHKNGFIHGEISPEAMINNGTGKLSIGKVKMMLGEYLTTKKNLFGDCYSASELQMEGMRYTENIDIWALGIATLELAMGRTIKGMDPSTITYENSLNPTIIRNNDLNRKKALFDFLFKALVNNPRLRSSAKELLQHPFIAQENFSCSRNLFGESKREGKRA